MFQHAIVRTPGNNFAEGLTTVDLGVSRYEEALLQHAHYCDALQACGLTITTLDADLRYPDSTFVEDTAVLTARGAILAHPGAPSRAGEIAAMRPTIRDFFSSVQEIEAPGTVDGGDICEAEEHFFLGLTHRTNEEGVRQMAVQLASLGYTSTVVDIRRMTGILHLKSAISYIGNNTVVVMEKMAGNALFRNYDLICVSPDESYAANCVRVNDRVLVAAGFPHLAAELVEDGFHPWVLDVSEFQKMDGGLSCLSLRF